MNLHDILHRIRPLPEDSFAKLEGITDELHVNKHELIISADRVCNDLYFVAEGIVRAFSYIDGRDITFWIGAEGAIALSMQGYINGWPGYENIVALENCRLYHTTVPKLKALYATDIEIANWGRNFAEKELLRTESCLIPHLFMTGRARYEALLKNQPELLNRIPLENLASYLGLTPVSLSRIRGSLKTGS